ncbi:hypothetical protein ACHAQH_005973 [Verticillium albo-atrum]
MPNDSAQKASSHTSLSLNSLAVHNSNNKHTTQTSRDISVAMDRHVKEPNMVPARIAMDGTDSVTKNKK